MNTTDQFEQAADGDTIFPRSGDDVRQAYEDAQAAEAGLVRNTSDRGPTA